MNKRNNKSKKINKRKHNKTKKGGTDSVNNILLTNQITCAANKSALYKQVGIVHATKTAGINALRDTISDIGNFFGAKGVDGPVYDHVRNEALQSLLRKITSNQKICDLRVDLENKEQMILVHSYGTLYQKK